MKKGFTLAEVLITLAIIGVVASLTIPNLIKNYEKQQTVVQLKKSYNTLSQAIQHSSIENGTPNTWDYSLSATDFFNRYLSKYIKVSKNLGEGKPETKMGVTYKCLNGEGIGEYIFAQKSLNLILPDGTFMYITYPYTNTSHNVVFDVNGKKKPNILGKDVFSFYFGNGNSKRAKGVRASGFTFKTREEILSTKSQACNKKAPIGGFYCTQLIILDNWQIKDDYPW